MQSVSRMYPLRLANWFAPMGANPMGTPYTNGVLRFPDTNRNNQPVEQPFPKPLQALSKAKSLFRDPGLEQERYKRLRLRRQVMEAIREHQYKPNGARVDQYA